MAHIRGNTDEAWSLAEEDEGITAAGQFDMQTATALDEQHRRRIDTVFVQCSGDVGVLVRQEAHVSRPDFAGAQCTDSSGNVRTCWSMLVWSISRFISTTSLTRCWAVKLCAASIAHAELN